MHALPRLIGVWLLVVGAAAAGLMLLDHVPTLLASAPRGARVYASIDEAERAIGARIWMPGYYPDELRWPPDRVEVAATRPPTVVVRVGGRDGDRARLTIVQTVGGDVPPPPGLLAKGQAMETTPTFVGDREATLARVLIGPSETHDLWWAQDGRRITLRYSGPVERLLLIAGSLERRARETDGRR